MSCFQERDIFTLHKIFNLNFKKKLKLQIILTSKTIYLYIFVCANKAHLLKYLSYVKVRGESH